ncbi:DUF2066 domain-containing protein [Colwellia sp. MSW7]|uniref:DUF2066 domain-containing protein n=1 Tax=Colwellia maritima TaxID=2912588 RepID=A0ABS9X1N9_9GAMM|nr:DUF2066 domain-containing protein [Colwellia maritima]MCI2284095.1 DUF2066 domain-containing protein [Colwellia maritima]
MLIFLHMFKKFTFLLFVIVAFLTSIAIKAVEVKDLYQASIAIDSQSSKDRAGALKKALAAVLLKVGGEKNVLDNDVIKNALGNYNSYLSQYRYQQKSLQIVDEKGSNKLLFLLVSFNQEKINTLFQEANLALWGSLRPKILLWLVDEHGLTRNIISSTSASNLPLVISEFSSQRGLPIMLPLMDLTDANQIKLSDIWGRFQQPIKDASNRYLPEAIAVVRISDSSLVALDYDNGTTESDNCGLLCTESRTKISNYVLDWSLLDWSLVEGQQKFSQQYQGNDPQALLQQGLADITELIYQYYALSATSDNDYIIDVENIDSLNTYVEVFHFLDELSSVKSVILVSAKGSKRRFKLQLLGTQEALLASLKLNKKLTQVIDPLAQFNEPADENDEPLAPVFNWDK